MCLTKIQNATNSMQPTCTRRSWRSGLLIYPLARGVPTSLSPDIFDLAEWIHVELATELDSSSKVSPTDQLKAIAFWLCLPIRRCGPVAERQLPQAVMSACCPFRPSHLPTEEGLLYATPQLLVSASTPQALSVSELRKHSSCAGTPKKSGVGTAWKQRFKITGFDDANPVSRSMVVGCFEFISRNAVGAEESQRSDRSNHTWLHSQQ